MKIPFKGSFKKISAFGRKVYPSNANNGLNKHPSDVLFVEKAMFLALIVLGILVVIVGIYAVVESIYPTVVMVDGVDGKDAILLGKILFLWGVFIFLSPLPYVFVKIFMAPHSYPDKLVVKRRRNPVAVYQRPDYRFFPYPFYSWQIINGKVIDIDTGKVDVEMPFGGKQIKMSVQFSASFQLDEREEVEIVVDEISKQTRMEKPAILAMHFASNEDLYEYFLEELIGQGTKLIGEYESPAKLIKSQKAVEEKFKTALTEQAQKFGYRVVDHNLRIFPDRVDIEADSIRILGKARAEVAQKFHDSLKNNWNATAAVIATEIASPLVSAAVKKIGGKTKNIGGQIEKIGSAISKAAEDDTGVKS